MSNIHNQDAQRKLVWDHFLATWDSSTYPVVFDQEVLDESLGTPEAFVRFSMPQADKSFDSFGGGESTLGLVIIQVFTKTSSLVLDRQLVDIVDGIFSRATLDSGNFYFDYPRVSYGVHIKGSPDKINTGFKQTNISINYTSK